MRDVMDCGVLLTPGHETAMGDWVARDQPRLTRVRLHLVPLRAPGDGPGDPDIHALAALAVGLRRYDHCILPVAPRSLAWTRLSLLQAGHAISTPILLFVHDMTAPAIDDLLRLGAADFMAAPYCLESLRVRLGRLTQRARAEPLFRKLEEPGAVYTVGAPRPARSAYARPRVPRQVLQQGLASLRYQPERSEQESFRQAKARVVDGFESDYIRLALSHHHGNVASAARASNKHRRAFWALMRKHGIEAAPYRRQAEAA